MYENRRGPFSEHGVDGSQLIWSSNFLFYT